jgi:hypothetical protein
MCRIEEERLSIGAGGLKTLDVVRDPNTTN